MNENWLFSFSRRAFLEPDDIAISWRRKPVGDLPVLDERRHGAGIEPPFDFRMAIGKSEPASAVVIKPWQVVEPGLLRMIGPAPHIGRKVPDVNAVLPHIEQ